MAINQCTCFCNNPRLVHNCAIRLIGKYLESMSTYADLKDGNIRLSTCGVVYRLNKQKVIECYVYDDFSDGWAQADFDNAENVMSHTGYVITYAGYPVILCSKLHTKTVLSTT